MTTKELIQQYVTAHADNRWMDASELEALLTEFAEEMKAKQVVTIKCEKKSPITGGEMQLMQERTSVKFRGEEVSFVKKYYHCVDSGQDFTDTELDNDNMWAIFRAYWERKGFEHFYDIDGYREEQEPASPCENCEGNGLPGTCASISSLGRCPLEYNKQEPTTEDLKEEITRYFSKNLIKRLTDWPALKNTALYFAQWQKEQDYKNLERLKKSWFKEGKIEGKFEGITDDVKYQQGYHDAKEQMMKDAIETTIDGKVVKVIVIDE